MLQEASVALLLRDQVPPLVPVKSVGFETEGVRYGLGTWLEPFGEGVLRASDPGAFGFTPWLDQDLGIGGVFAVRDRVGRVLPQLRKVQDEVRAAVQSPLVAGTEETVVLTHGGRTALPPARAAAVGAAGGRACRWSSCCTAAAATARRCASRPASANSPIARASWRCSRTAPARCAKSC